MMGKVGFCKVELAARCLQGIGDLQGIDAYLVLGACRTLVAYKV